MNTGTIHYGFGAEYLPTWGIKEALREIYQNFMDYGDYEEQAILKDGIASVKLINGWLPDSLEYLRIGSSKKSNPNAIGKHGEGLKMAFLILLRNGFNSMIFTNKYAVYPEWYKDTEIGDCFCFNYEIHDFAEAPYSLEFECKEEDFIAFKENIITTADIIYSDGYFGDIVDKPSGNLYSGNLFVTKLDNLNRSYNIKPAHLPLDRDRSVPKAFDVNWAASKILQSSQKMTTKDLSYSDTAYIDNVPDNLLKEFKPRRVGDDIQFTVKDETGKDQVINNPALKEVLKKHSFFEKAIMGIKKFLVKQLGLYDMLIQFKEKHVHGTEALQDFNIILEKVNSI